MNKKWVVFSVSWLLVLASCGGSSSTTGGDEDPGDSMTGDNDPECVNDVDCGSSSLICSNNVCVSACGAGCAGGGLACCDAVCLNTRFSSQACGDCATSCANGQYCQLDQGCLALNFEALCTVTSAVVIEDGVGVDDAAGAILGNAVAGLCSTGAPQVVAKTNATYLDQTTGEPLNGPGTGYIVAGGSFFQPVVQYLQDQGLAAVLPSFDSNNNVTLTRTDTGMVVITDTLANSNAGHDYFVIQSVYVETRGIFLFNLYGVLEFGTTAGAWYFANVLVPAVGVPDGWMVVEWTDGNANNVADDANEFTVLASN